MDNHELRMGAGQAAMDGVDVLDDETIEHLRQVAEAIDGLIGHFEEQGSPPLVISNMVVGTVVGMMFQWNEDRHKP